MTTVPERRAEVIAELGVLDLTSPQFLLARRAGRIAFGAVLLLGATSLVIWAWPPRRTGTSLHAATILTASWAAAFLFRALARHWVMRRPWSRALDAGVQASLALPAAGVALLLPLTLHMPIAVLAGSLDGFDEWTRLSLVITGAAHVALAVLCVSRGLKLLAGVPTMKTWGIYLITIGVSCAPFVLLYAIPPILVAATALGFFPLAPTMDVIAARERAFLASAPRTLPLAVVIGPRG